MWRLLLICPFLKRFPHGGSGAALFPTGLIFVAVISAFGIFVLDTGEQVRLVLIIPNLLVRVLLFKEICKMFTLRGRLLFFIGDPRQNRLNLLAITLYLVRIPG